MAYSTNGSVHRIGIKKEKLAKQIIESGCTKTFGPSPVVEHLGGTTNKADLVVDGKYLVSHKHRNGKSGSYDYANLSNTSGINSKHFVALREHYESVKGKYKKANLTKQEFKILHEERERSNIGTLLSEALFNMTPSEIKSVVRRGLASYLNNSKYFFSITHEKNKTLTLFKAKDHPLMRFLDKNPTATFSLEKGRGATSAKVIFTDSSGQVEDFGLRLRLVLNNGIGALLGGKKLSSNSTSNIVFKLQQDNPDKYILQIKNREVKKI